MKLLRYRVGDTVRPGMLAADGTVRDLSDHVEDITGATLDDAALAKLAALDVAALPVVEGNVDLAPCVGGVGKFLCIGLNYSDHAEEAGMSIPEHPILFMKATSAIVGPNDDVVLPRGSVAGDWEVELGVVIGKTAKYVSEEDALDYVAGYCVVNDVSERDFQIKLTGQWTKGKSCDTFGPIGPWLVSRDEVADPQNLSLSCDVNGQRMQSGTTGKMIFSVAEIIAHLSQLMTLHPGDVIATGTPPGVGMGIKPDPIYLKPGDVMELEIEGLGRQRQTVRADD
ncbi:MULTISPECIES: fumarylacetoacetate hydrolase family protein [Rhodobacterales]|jgi:2-keto-4-pentenoate hydratase/2-oxohepta-3-ene-1,7-dioic acid hydratase in catechol pathway|uniref:fumarylacetoacetate hydrolase family protein n=1 Tax=Rhodobacterales TaxID=204455 RepID=UPI00237FADB8|nr:fumarylacetoacetate hydrolase family protein [Phaeobacter gallaeciensis]MDE4098286.1 fumarylacetoacetate hydrolase family protein [Phaeobacter gallaeciensis]MDE4107096.1 fumarylacetoacetate hydrolase family protein [Phaeobacter gallaeciensis]MDE4111445.1 fumarylacetoacetate hydrolase family protein [Phaeobacter gallaeciensis]MDE4116021.1 fumarylacetoacetate hydrolase family protein [Phaeobacter gallaeciensis]MDE4120386.1 fumarylacetoacetate hydrolase family protein [Phaeobacter gallaeciensi